MTYREKCERMTEDTTFCCTDECGLCSDCPLYEGEFDCAKYLAEVDAAKAWIANDDKNGRNKMTKQEALKQIKEPQTFVEEMDKPKSGVAILEANHLGHHINGTWAFSVMSCTEGTSRAGSTKAGRSASLYLTRTRGAWYDENGNEVPPGYLYFKPDGE